MHLDHSHRLDASAARTRLGMRAITFSFIGLLITAVIQAVVVAFSGSVALLADTIHNLGDATTAIPLWIGFYLGQRRETRRFTYGLHRAEDLAGILIIMAIAASAAFAGYESIRKLMAEEEPTHLPWAIGAGVIGFLGNELIAQYRIRVGRQINSASLIADGHHARADGLTSLAVVGGLVGVALGHRIADPIVGLVITGLIAIMLFREAGPIVLGRILDRVDAYTVAEFERVAGEVEGVRRVHAVRARWTGHFLLGELNIHVDGRLTVSQGHEIAEMVEHRLIHEMPMLYHCIVHVEPTDEEDSS